MKRNIFILALLTLFACKDSGGFDLSYPLFEISDVVVIEVDEITVDVTFTHVGSEETLRHGFVWDWIRIPSLGTFGTISNGRGFTFIEGPPNFNGFTESIKTSFQRSQRHSIRAFVITPTDTIYSTVKEFTANP